MAALWIEKAVDVFEDGHPSLASCLLRMPPDQFSFNGLEEGLYCCIVVIIAVATHGQLGAVLTQNFRVSYDSSIGTHGQCDGRSPLAVHGTLSPSSMHGLPRHASSDY